jgi:biotin carboxyl carrier protein
MKKYVLEIGEKEYNAEVKSITTEEVDIVVNGEQYKVRLKSFGRRIESLPRIERVERPVQSPIAPVRAPHKTAAANTEAGGELVRAPLPGLILDVAVKAGDVVKAGQNLLVMEAMKMENQVEAPHDGTVQKVYVQKGDSVAEDDALVELSRPLMTTI